MVARGQARPIPWAFANRTSPSSGSRASSAGPFRYGRNCNRARRRLRTCLASGGTADGELLGRLSTLAPTSPSPTTLVSAQAGEVVLRSASAVLGAVEERVAV